METPSGWAGLNFNVHVTVTFYVKQVVAFTGVYGEGWDPWGVGML